MSSIKEKINKSLTFKYLKRLLNIINRAEMRILPGSIAFFLFMAIVPAILIIAIICTKFSFSVTDIIIFFEDILPRSVEEVLLSITKSSIDGYSIGFLILSLLLASNGPHAIILASNTLYGIDNSNYLVRRIKSFVLTIILMSLFLFILIVIAFGNVILKFILELSIFEGIASNIYNLFIILKWPFAIIIIALFIKVLYTIAPDKKIKSKYVNKGVIFTTIGWVISTAIYSYYANNMAKYDIIYGSLSNIIILIIWVYVISYILVIGIAINTNYYNYNLENKKIETE